MERNVERLSTLLLRQQYPSLMDGVQPKSEINNFELGVYSQNGEDGILLYIFSQIGTTNRSFVEFGIQDGRECNTANLCINFGWKGLLMDINPNDVISARAYYSRMLGTRASDVKIIQCMVTAENINQILAEQQTDENLDLLVIDIDSNDFWVWKAIHVVRPRVVVIEYNAVFGPERSLTVKYQPEFDRFQFHFSGWYQGASLTALARLGESKGYALVGCDSSGSNAFFVRKDEITGRLSPVSPSQAYYSDVRYLNDVRDDGHLIPPDQFEAIRHLEFVEIS